MLPFADNCKVSTIVDIFCHKEPRSAASCSKISRNFRSWREAQSSMRIQEGPPLDRCINQSEIFWKPCEPAHTVISQPWGIYAPLVRLRPGGSDAKSLVWTGLRSHNCQSGAGAGVPQEFRRVREG